MKKIIENWNTYQDRVLLLESRILNESYITNTLGIKIPLNESYPYSKDLNEEILREHLLFESFWGNLGSILSDKVNATYEEIKNKWDEAKEFPSKVKEVSFEIYKAFVGGKMKEYGKSVFSASVKPNLKKIKSFLDVAVEKMPNSPTLKLVITKLSEIEKKANELRKSFNTGRPDPDRDIKALSLTVIAAGLHYFIHGIVGEQTMDKIISTGSEIALRQELLDKIMDRFKDITISIVRTSFGDVTEWLEYIAKIVGGVRGVVSFFSEIIKNFTERLEGIEKFGGIDFLKENYRYSRYRSKNIGNIILNETK